MNLKEGGCGGYIRWLDEPSTCFGYIILRNGTAFAAFIAVSVAMLT